MFGRCPIAEALPTPASLGVGEVPWKAAISRCSSSGAKKHTPSAKEKRRRRKKKRQICMQVQPFVTKLHLPPTEERYLQKCYSRIASLPCKMYTKCSLLYLNHNGKKISKSNITGFTLKCYKVIFRAKQVNKGGVQQDPRT